MLVPRLPLRAAPHRASLETVRERCGPAAVRLQVAAPRERCGPAAVRLQPSMVQVAVQHLSGTAWYRLQEEPYCSRAASPWTAHKRSPRKRSPRERSPRERSRADHRHAYAHHRRADEHHRRVQHAAYQRHRKSPCSVCPRLRGTLAGCSTSIPSSSVIPFSLGMVCMLSYYSAAARAAR